MIRRGCYSLALVCGAVLSGCGGKEEWTADRPKPFPASGTVRYNDQPVAGASVVFHPQGQGRAAVAQTDSAGIFRLQTYSRGDGAVPGEYKVTITKVEVSSQGDPEVTNVHDTGSATQRSLIPEKYGKAESSELTASVTEGGDNKFNFELHD